MKCTHSTDWEDETVLHAIQNDGKIKTLCGKWSKIGSIDRECPTCPTCSEIRSFKLYDEATEWVEDLEPVDIRAEIELDPVSSHHPDCTCYRCTYGDDAYLFNIHPNEY